MSYLIDTNILVRSSSVSDPNRPLTLKAVNELQQRGDALFLARQSLYEYWTVATRPMQNNGLGLTAMEARKDVDDYVSAFILLPEPEGLFQAWLDLVTSTGIVGKKNHDARLAALAILQGIPYVLTYNIRDFAPFSGVIAVDPATI